jgi:RNA polymerase sigma factor (sigma-70 family)
VPRVRQIPFAPERFNIRSLGQDVTSNGRGDANAEGGDGVQRQPPYHPTVAVSLGTPESELQALMETRPGDEPDASIAERQALRTLFADAVDTLPERERYVIEALFWERLSLRDLALRMSLSKTQLSRIRDTALERLRGALGNLEP